MKQPAAIFFPPVALDLKAQNPLYRQLYGWFRHAIVNGQLRPGQRLPSTRSLATELSVSRITVVNAFEQLHAEGYLEGRTGSGTFVSRSIPDEMHKPVKQVKARKVTTLGGPRAISHYGKTLDSKPTQTWPNNLGAFRASLPALDHFPVEIWSRLVLRHSRGAVKDVLAYGDPMGHVPLRKAIADYLNTVRAVRCGFENIMIVTGSQQGLQIAARVLLDSGNRAWVEDPGYPGAKQALAAAGAELVPVTADDEGLNVSAGIRRAGDARAVYVTPSHQYPLGVTMSARRRMQLLNWATQSGAWIIEDDYDSEYRFAKRPIASLQGLDSDARVIYIGTFSKVLFPAIRLGYVVVPRDLVHAFAAAREEADIFSSTLYQLVVTDFINDGHFARHIRRMRMLYMERCNVLLSAVRTELGDKLQILNSEGGMHVVGFLPPGTDDESISREAAMNGISVMPLSSCYIKHAARGGLILGYGGTNPAEIRHGVRRLALVLKQVQR